MSAVTRLSSSCRITALHMVPVIYFSLTSMIINFYSKTLTAFYKSMMTITPCLWTMMNFLNFSAAHFNFRESHPTSDKSSPATGVTVNFVKVPPISLVSKNCFVPKTGYCCLPLVSFCNDRG